MHPKKVLVALALIAGVCSPSHAQKDKEKGQEGKAVVQAAKTIPAKGGKGAKVSGTLPTVFVVNSAVDEYDWNPGDGVCEALPKSGECTLRAAVMEANSTAPGSTIEFEPTLFATPQTIELVGEMSFTRSMTINGPGADKLSISGIDEIRIFFLENSAEVTIRDLTLRNGNASVGAALYLNGANATLERVHIRDSHATLGAAAFVNFGTLTVTRCAMTGNTSDGGGAIYNVDTVLIKGSTFSGNSGLNGGGIFNGGLLDVSDSTFTNNWSDVGGGIYNAGTMAMRNSIVAGNFAPEGELADIYPSYNYGSLGNNLIGISDGVIYGPGDQVGTFESPLDAKLGLLGNNGGPTPTHALMSGSPAIDRGLSSEPFDQRGMARVVDHPEFINADTGADIGAFEVQTTSAAPVRVSGRVTDARGRSVIGATVSFVAAGGHVRAVRANSFGYYSATDLRSGESYAVTVKDRSGRTFATLMFTPTGDTDGLDFTAR